MSNKIKTNKEKQKKQLNLSTLKKLDKQNNATKDIELDLGELGSYTVTIDLKFKNTLIEAMVKELGEKIEYVQQEGVDVKDFDIGGYMFVLLVKNFTSLGKIVPDSLEEQIEFYKIIVDNEILGKIIQEFPVDEIKRLTGLMEEYRKAIVNSIDEQKEINEEMQKVVDEVKSSGDEGVSGDVSGEKEKIEH